MLSNRQSEIIKVLEGNELTSVEILQKTNNEFHILNLYSDLDSLRRKGLVRSFMKENIKFHYIV